MNVLGFFISRTMKGGLIVLKHSFSPFVKAVVLHEEVTNFRFHLRRGIAIDRVGKSNTVASIKEELDYWSIPYELISDCCWAAFEDGEINRRVIDHIDSALKDPYSGIKPKTLVRQNIWLTLTDHCYSTNAKIFNLVYVATLVFTIALFVAESVQDLRYVPRILNKTHERHRLRTYDFIKHSIPVVTVRVLDTGCWIFFTLEFFVRAIVCPSRRIFFRAKLNMMDLFLIVTVWASMLLELCVYRATCFGITWDFDFTFHIHTPLRYMTALRVLRVFQLMERNEITHITILTLKTTAYSLTLLMIGVLVVAMLLGSLLYVVEVSAGMFVFKNVALACWCTFITMMAVGYGDIIPTTAPGCAVAILSSMCGVVLLALPIAIISTQFSTYIKNLQAQKHRRKREKCLKDHEINIESRKISILWTSMTKGNVDTEPGDDLPPPKSCRGPLFSPSPESLSTPDLKTGSD